MAPVTEQSNVIPATEAAVWRFSVGDASTAARDVVHHDPETPWGRIPVPDDSDAADASVRALSAEFTSLPISIRGALGRATTNAAQLSDDKLQGLSELLQNADDVGATDAYFIVDPDGARLMFGHNGGDLTLPDVWGLTIPWLSEKASTPDALGRFGIGLKTLQTLSDTLDVHNGFFHLHLGSSTLEVTDLGPNWYGPDLAKTIFVIPFQHAAATEGEVREWLTAWGDAGLIFLRSLRAVSLLDTSGATLARLQVAHSGRVEIALDGGITTRELVMSGEGRSWLLYQRDAPSPTGTRAGKARGETTPVGIAFPQFAGDQGHLHVGLPIRPVGLPFRVTAQFDPLASRRDIAASDWNLDLIGQIANLWRDAALDLFAREPHFAWSAVPLRRELASDVRTSGPIRDAISRALLTGARLDLAESLRLDDGHGTKRPLSELAYESPDLTGILNEDDVRSLAGATGVVAAFSRSNDGRWRDVLTDLDELGAATPTVVGTPTAIALFDDGNRTIEFLCDLTSAVVAAARTRTTTVPIWRRVWLRARASFSTTRVECVRDDATGLRYIATNRHRAALADTSDRQSDSSVICPSGVDGPPCPPG
jgi:hypothetical protein